MEKFVEDTSRVPDKESNYQDPQNIKNFKFDLHGFTLDEANKKVESFITDCFDQKDSKVIIVTGKGLHSQNDKDPYISKNLSILKYSVPEFITNNQELMSLIYEIKDASVEDGGSGAFYIFLKKKPIK